MKKKILLVVPTILLASCGEQAINTHVKKIVNYDNKDTVVETTEFTYDGDNVLTMKQVSEKVTSLLTYVYNSDGEVIRFTTQTLKDGKYENKLLSTFSYDNRGLLISIQDFRYNEDTVSYALTEVSVYEYDDRGNNTRSRSISYNEDLSVYMQYEILSQYNAENMNTRNDQYLLDLGCYEMVYFGGEVYEYQTDNKTILKETNLDSNGDPMMVKTYFYNDDKTVKEINTVRVEEGVETPFKVETFEYNANKDKTMHKSVYSDNGYGNDVVTWEYDKDNRLTKESYFDLEGDNQILDSYYVYSY